MYRFLGIVVPVVALCSWLALSGRSEGPNEGGGFMQLKLRYGQKLLEGIALEDYDMIADQAEQLRLLSQDANWIVLQTPDYLADIVDFRRSAADLKTAAKKKNLDGAALAYMRMTLSCVHCHQHVRDVRGAKLKTTPGTDLSE
jgi:hypothetical protein